MSDSLNSENIDKNIIVIMAGGDGKRMQSNLPKVLHLLKDKPMLIHILEKAIVLNPLYIYIIVGKHKELILNTIKEYIDIDIINQKIKFTIQNSANGTGDAIKCWCNNINYLKLMEYNILILSGDVPLISIDTMKLMLRSKYPSNILISYTENNNGYGRIVQEYNNIKKCQEFKKIIEERDCTDIEKSIKIINTGIYSFNCYLLCKNIFKIENNNAQSEYYLTDIFEIINKKYENHVNLIKLDKNKFYEITGVNTKEQLEYLEDLEEIAL